MNVVKNNDGGIGDFGDSKTISGTKLHKKGCGEPVPVSSNPKIKDEKESLNSFVQYSQFGNAFIPCGKTQTRLDSGAYKLGMLDTGLPTFQKTNVRSDSWLTFQDELICDVVKEINTFWASREKFKKYGFLQRRGYIFYGPPGTGKTILVKQLIEKIIENDGVVFICDSHPSTVTKALKHFTDIEKERNIICVFEDIDSLIDHYGESDLLALLDGEDAVDNVLNIATTNYPEKLDRRIIGRPRRFDRVIKISYPDEITRKMYFEYKMVDSEDIEKWVKATERFTFAAMTELVISVKCLGNDFEKSVEKIGNLLSLKPKSTDCELNNIGFGS